MSTNIHHGILFLQSDLLAIHAQVMAYRSVVAALAVEADRAWVADRCALRLDEAAAQGMDAPRHVLFDVRRELWDRQALTRKMHASRDPSVDTEFTLLALPWEGRVYGLLYTERPEWRKDFLGRGIAERHAFWDSTDPEEGISEEEWALRGRTWDAIFAQDASHMPGACGITFEFPVPPHVVGSDDVLACVPTTEARLARTAKGRVLYARQAATRKDDRDMSSSGFFDAIDWLATDEGAAALAAEVERLRPILPEITRETLSG